MNLSLPIDIPGLIKAMANIRDSTNTSLAVSVFIDDSAPGDVIGHVRAAFASGQATTRVTISYLSQDMPVPYEADDMAVIVAGLSENIGKQAAYLRSCGIPVMVVTTLPSLVNDTAVAFGYPIPKGDIIAPKVVANDADADGEGDGSGGGNGESSEASELIVLNDAAAASLDMRMGEWIITARRDKRSAFALSFPFVRRPLSLDSVHATALENAAIGLIPFVRGADMPIMTLNQAKMLLQIAAVYGEKIGLARLREIAVVVAGGFVCRGVSRRIAGFIPVLGWAVRAAVGFAGTEAMGRAAIEYFEVGGDIVGVASVVQSARDGVASAATTIARNPMGKRALDLAKSAAKNAVGTVRQVI